LTSPVPCGVHETPSALKAAAGLLRAQRLAAEATEGSVSSSEPGVSSKAKDLFVRLVDAWVRLDRYTPRADFLGLTPEELDRIAPRADAHVRRARFYEDVCSALESARAAHAAPRARRMAEREAIWCALERAGLVTRIRGGGKVPAFKAEGVSLHPTTLRRCGLSRGRVVTGLGRCPVDAYGSRKRVPPSTHQGAVANSAILVTPSQCRDGTR